MPKHKPDVRFVISTKRDNYSKLPEYSVTLRAVVIQDGDVKNPGYFYRDDPDYPTNAYNDLAVTALCDESGRWFGSEVRYQQPYCVDLDRAAEMVLTLRRVRKSLERSEREFGHPESFPAYAMRVARALGATAERPFGWRDARAHDGTGFIWQSTDGLRHILTETFEGKRQPTDRS